MTIIQPQKKSLINILLGFIISFLVIGVVILVILYSYVINFNKNISNAKNEIKEIEIANTQIKEDLLNMLSGNNLENLANEFGLVKEKNPEYLKINNNQWQVGLNF